MRQVERVSVQAAKQASKPEAGCSGVMLPPRPGLSRSSPTAPMLAGSAHWAGGLGFGRLAAAGRWQPWAAIGLSERANLHLTAPLR